MNSCYKHCDKNCFKAATFFTLSRRWAALNEWPPYQQSELHVSSPSSFRLPNPLGRGLLTREVYAPPPTEAHITYSAAIVMRHVNPSGTGPYQPYKQIIAPLEVMLAHQYQWACGGEKEWDNKIMNIQKRHRGRDPTGDQINCSTPTWNACWWMTVIVRVLNIYVLVYKYMHTYINTWVHAYMNTRIRSCKYSLN